MTTEYVTVPCTVVRFTDNAVLIIHGDTLDDVAECWVPLSLCEAPDTIEKDDEEITVAKWFAKRESLPY